MGSEEKYDGYAHFDYDRKEDNEYIMDIIKFIEDYFLDDDMEFEELMDDIEESTSNFVFSKVQENVDKINGLIREHDQILEEIYKDDVQHIFAFINDEAERNEI